MQSQAQIKLKTSCYHCSASKLKCSGQLPCDRCSKTGRDCYYTPVKARRAKEKQLEDFNETSKRIRTTVGQATDAVKVAELLRLKRGPASLDASEKRIWSIFFALYKQYGETGCNALWLRRQLLEMHRFLSNAVDNRQMLNRFEVWLGALNVNIADLAKKSPFQIRHDEVTQHDEHHHAPPPSSVAGGVPQSFMFETLYEDVKNEAKQKRLPTLFISTEGEVTINNEFVSHFGVTKQELELILQVAGGYGFLPHFGDVWVKLLAKENDVMLLLQTFSMALMALGRPDTIPFKRMIPINTIYQVKSKSGNSYPCFLKIVYVESATMDRIYCELFASFVVSNEAIGPVKELPPLMNLPQPAQALPSFPAEYGESVQLKEHDEAWLDALLDWTDDDQESIDFPSDFERQDSLLDL